MQREPRLSLCLPEGSQNRIKTQTTNLRHWPHNVSNNNVDSCRFTWTMVQHDRVPDSRTGQRIVQSWGRGATDCGPCSACRRRRPIRGCRGLRRYLGACKGIRPPYNSYIRQLMWKVPPLMLPTMRCHELWHSGKTGFDNVISMRVCPVWLRLRVKSRRSTMTPRAMDAR